MPIQYSGAIPNQYVYTEKDGKLRCNCCNKGFDEKHPEPRPKMLLIKNDIGMVYVNIDAVLKAEF